MTSSVAVHRTLNPEALKELANQKGPCITMFIPDRHPGAQAGSRPALVRDTIHHAEARLRKNPKFKAHAADLLAPLPAFAEMEETEGGGPGFGIFRSPNKLEVFDLPGVTEGRLEVGNHFYLLPLLDRAYPPQDFHILALSRKHLRLLRYRHGVCELIALPAKVPESVEAAGGFDQPDHDLENRSSSGAGTGSMKGVHFGTLSDREAAGEYLYHFFGIVARGLKETLNGQPLLLAGVHEEIALYRRASKDANILETAIEGSVDFMPLDEMARRASGAAREQFLKNGRKVLAEFREMTDRGRAMGGDPHAVLRVAAAGRVHQLCVRAGAKLHEELLNAAAVETIAHGGEVYALPLEEMPDSNPLAAILRF